MQRTLRYLPIVALAFAAACANDNPVTNAITGPAPRFAGTPPDGPITGAIWTSTVGCLDVNHNIYTSQADVYINGGPGPGNSALQDGAYYVQVTAPDGTLLGTSLGTTDELPVVVSGGNFVACYQLSSIVRKASTDVSGGPVAPDGYDPTGNPGGEYKVWISSHSTFDNNYTKTDNFKVREGSVTDYGTFTVDKFFDANGNGVLDLGEQYIQDWPMTLNELVPASDATKPTPASWTFLDPGTYSVTEGLPTPATGWYISYKGASDGLKTSNLLSSSILLTAASASDLTIGNIVINANGSESRLFGNYCTVGSGGLTLGFWSNNNGMAILAQHDQAWRLLLNAVDLVKASPNKTGGFTVTPYDVPVLPTAFATFNAKKQLNGGAFYSFMQWILAAQSSINGEARYMLSAQLAAMMLNVAYGGVNGNNFDPASQMTINQLIAAAQNALTDQTVSRNTVIQIKTWLDNLNKGGPVIPSDCGVTLISPS